MTARRKVGRTRRARKGTPGRPLTQPAQERQAVRTKPNQAGLWPVAVSDVIGLRRAVGNRSVSQLMARRATAVPATQTGRGVAEIQRQDGDKTTSRHPDRPPGVGRSELAWALRAAGTTLLKRDAAAGELVMPALWAAATGILAPPAIEAWKAEYVPEEAKAAKKTPEPEKPKYEPGPLESLLDYIVNAIGGRPRVDKPGSEGDPVVRAQALSLDAIHLHVGQLMSQPRPLYTRSSNMLTEEQVNLFLERVEALRAFYNNMLPRPRKMPTEPGEMPTEKERPEDPARLRLVANAMADLGKVRAKETDAEGKRIGHEYLKHIFDTAWPDHGEPDTLFEKRPRGHKEDPLPSWCGVGATFWAKKAYPHFPNWKRGKSITQFLQGRGKRELPEVGDIVQSQYRWHHGIVSWVDPDAQPPTGPEKWKQIRIRTVEANWGGRILQGPPEHQQLGWWTVGVFKPYPK